MRLIDAVRAAKSGPKDPDTLSELAARVAEEGPKLSQAEGKALVLEMEALVRATKESMDELAAQLREVGSSRRAMKGYGGLRAHHQGQRLFRKA